MNAERVEMTTSKTAEEELLDDVAQSIVRSLLLDEDIEDSATVVESERLLGVHDKDTEEQDADDKDGLQGGQNYDYPTRSPTVSPTTAPTDPPTVSPTYLPTLEPTTSPTYYPTPKSDPFLLKGDVWYDRNANGVRDSNVAVPTLGDDVEYSVGLGGVITTLWSCGDEENGNPLVMYPEGAEVMYSTRTNGMDATGRPVMATSAGRFIFTGIQISRSYFVHVVAPADYLLTTGVCNDDEEGWACDPDTPLAEGADVHLGVTSGRTGCIDVDRQGIPSEHLSVGIMREGDSQREETTVALVLDFDQQEQRGLLSRALRGADGRWLLAEQDKVAIGSVTAEVLAGSLDQKLKEVGVELDGVTPQQVIVSGVGGATDQLAVALEVKGHYSPPPNIDFAFVVQESINAETDQIRRNLRDYNTNCRQQTSLINSGQATGAQDFQTAVDSTGKQQNRPSKNRDETNSAGPVGAVYHDACGKGFGLPSIFETSLKEIEVKDVAEVEFASRSGGARYVEPEKAFADWALGPVAAIAGLIAMLAGAFVFRRAMGPRRADKFDDLRLTKDLENGGETRRFGEMGGAMDDGSVDSAFYSEDDDDEYNKKMGKKSRADRDAKRKEKSFRSSSKKDQGRTMKKEKSYRQGKPKTAFSKMKSVGNSLRGSGSNFDETEETEPLSGSFTDGKGLRASLKRSLTAPLRQSLKSSFTSNGSGKKSTKKGKKRDKKRDKDSLRASTQSSEGTLSIEDVSDNEDMKKPSAAAARRRSSKSSRNELDSILAENDKKPDAARKERAMARKKAQNTRNVLGTDGWEKRDVEKKKSRRGSGEKRSSSINRSKSSSSMKSEQGSSRSSRSQSQTRTRSRSSSRTRGRSRASGGDNARKTQSSRSIV